MIYLSLNFVVVLYFLHKRKESKVMTHLYEKLQNQEEKLAVIGLGYVGVPLAVAFSKKVDTIGA